MVFKSCLVSINYPAHLNMWKSSWDGPQPLGSQLWKVTTDLYGGCLFTLSIIARQSDYSHVAVGKEML